MCERLSEMGAQFHSPDLAKATDETLAEANCQLGILRQVFEMLGASPDMRSCSDIIDRVEDAFSAIHQETEPELRPLSLLNYLLSVQNIGNFSLRMLVLAASLLANNEILRLLGSLGTSDGDPAVVRAILSSYDDD